MNPLLAARSRRVRVLTLLLLLITWTALQFRLNDVPPGFQHDQMFNSTDALDVLQGRHQLYFPANFGREPLGIYATAGAFALAGGHYVWSFRFAGTVWAILGLAATVSLARRYVPAWAALFAAALMAGSFWFVFAGRLGLEPIALMPLSVAMFYFLDRALTRHSYRDAGAAGVFGGLAMYTYLASRVLFALPILLLVSGLAYTAARRWQAGRSRPGRSSTGQALGLRNHTKPFSRKDPVVGSAALPFGHGPDQWSLALVCRYPHLDGRPAPG